VVGCPLTARCPSGATRACRGLCRAAPRRCGAESHRCPLKVLTVPAPFCAAAAAARPQVVINVTGVVANGGENICRRKPLSGEQCVPDATLLPDASGALLFPGVSPFRLYYRGKPGRVYLLRFRASVPATGLACAGWAPVCVIKQHKDLNGMLPPKCQPFPFANTVRIATTCNNFTLPTLADAAAELP
jgi:hypothetical protein